MTHAAPFAFLVPLIALVVGCGTAPDKIVTDQVVPVACGTCIYKIPDGVGCYWAIELDGQHYPMAGTLPRDHENHAPDGMCNIARRAKVTGELRGPNFVASSFELLPPGDLPEAPRYTPADDHRDHRPE